MKEKEIRNKIAQILEYSFNGIEYNFLTNKEKAIVKNPQEFEEMLGWIGRNKLLGK